jgi:hypothetical protein
MNYFELCETKFIESKSSTTDESPFQIIESVVEDKELSIWEIMENRMRQAKVDQESIIVEDEVITPLESLNAIPTITTSKIDNQVDSINEIYSKIETEFGYDFSSENYSKGLSLCKYQVDFIQDYFNANSRQSKIHDVLINCFKAMNTGRKYVNGKYIELNNIDGAGRRRIKSIFESIEWVSIKKVAKEIQYSLIANKLDKTPTFIEYKKATSVRFNALATSHGLVTKHHIEEWQNSDKVTFNRDELFQNSIVKDFHSQVCLDLPSVDKILSDIANDNSLSIEQKKSYSVSIPTFIESDVKITKSNNSGRTYSVQNSLSKWAKRNYLSGYCEYDMKSAHASMLGAMISRMISENKKEVSTFSEINLNEIWEEMFNLTKGVSIDGKYFSPLTLGIEELILEKCEVGEILVKFDMESIADLAKKVLVTYLYETRNLSGLNLKLNEIADHYFTMVCPKIRLFLNHLKILSRLQNRSIIHLELTKTEQSLIVPIMGELASCGILSANEHDGIMIKIENDLMKSDVRNIIDDCLNIANQKDSFFEFVNIILKRSY